MNLKGRILSKLGFYSLACRNYLLKNPPFFFIYCVWLRRLDAYTHHDEIREDWKRHGDLLSLVLRKLANAPIWISCKAQRRLLSDNFYYCIPFAPNKFLMKERVFCGKKFQLLYYPWKIGINKRRDRPFWQDMDIGLGRLLNIAVRWDDGQRDYVSMRFWRINHEYYFYGGDGEFGKFEFYHELWRIEGRYPVSRWWWGSGWFRKFCCLGNFEELYRHFGHLFRWNWNGRRYGFLGKELSAREKEAVLAIYERERKKWDKKTERMYLDAITGFSRNPSREYFWACCIDCRRMMHPECESDLRCDECNYKHLGINAV